MQHRHHAGHKFWECLATNSFVLWGVVLTEITMAQGALAYLAPVHGRTQESVRLWEQIPQTWPAQEPRIFYMAPTVLELATFLHSPLKYLDTCHLQLLMRHGIRDWLIPQALLVQQNHKIIKWFLLWLLFWGSFSEIENKTVSRKKVLFISKYGDDKL